jgi:hypothetical protein
VKLSRSDRIPQSMSREDIENFEINSSDPFEHQKERKDRIEYMQYLDLRRFDNQIITLTYSNLHPKDRQAFDALYAHMRETGYKYGHLPRDRSFLELFQGTQDSSIVALFDDTEEDKDRVIKQVLSTRPEKQLFEDGCYRVCQILLTHFYNQEAEVVEVLYEDVFPILEKFDKLLHLQLTNPVHQRIYTYHIPGLRYLTISNRGEFITGTTRPWSNYHLFSHPKILDKSVFLSDIRMLNIFQTPIFEFPDLIGDEVSNMVEMRFEHLTFTNGIDKLGNYAHKFPYLYTLRFNNTEGVKIIPQGLYKLTNLHEFKVSDDTLEYIAPDLADTPQLIYVRIRSKNIKVYDLFVTKLINTIYDTKRLIVSISMELNREIAFQDINTVSEEVIHQLTELFAKKNEINQFYANIPDDVWIQMNKRAYDLMIKYSKQVSWFDHMIYSHSTNIGLFGHLDGLLKVRGADSCLNVPATENWEAFTLYFGPIHITPYLDDVIYPINENPKDPRYF